MRKLVLAAVMSAMALTADVEALASDLPKTAADLGLMSGFPPAADQLVTKDNWLAPPYNRWAYQNARRLFPTQGFARSSSPGSLPLGQMISLDSMTFADAEGAEKDIDTFLQQYYSDAFLIVHRGQIVYERYWNAMTSATPHMVFSITKSFTGTLVYKMVERGLLDIDAQIATYIPELEGSGFGDATVRQALDMLINVDWDESPAGMADPEGVFMRYVAASGFVPAAETGSAYEFLQTMEKAGEHGGTFRYVSPTTDVLGWLLERVTGEAYTDLLDKEIMSKLSLEGDGMMVLDGWGKAASTGGLVMTARDLSRFGLAIQNGGTYNSKRILSEPFLADTRYGGDKEAYTSGEKDSSFMPGGAYRNQIWMSPGEKPRFLALGIYGQNLYVNPEKQVVVVRLSSTPGSFNEVDDLMLGVYDKIADHLSAN